VLFESGYCGQPSGELDGVEPLRLDDQDVLAGYT
jgi:hypothetical protein